MIISINIPSFYITRFSRNQNALKLGNSLGKMPTTHCNSCEHQNSFCILFEKFVLQRTFYCDYLLTWLRLWSIILGYTKLDVPCGTDNQGMKHFFCKVELGLVKNWADFSNKGILKLKLHKNHFNKTIGSFSLFYTSFKKKIERFR